MGPWVDRTGQGLPETIEIQISDKEKTQFS
jgi:hypothetical protein